VDVASTKTVSAFEHLCPENAPDERLWRETFKSMIFLAKKVSKQVQNSIDAHSDGFEHLW
jgi:hypothetical protein